MQIKFMLDYSCSPLWTSDRELQAKYGYNIDLKKIGLSTETIKKAEIVVSMFYDSLNPIYQMFPSFWREELCVEFNQKVADVYKNICWEISNRFEITDLTRKFTEDEERRSFVDDPVHYCLQHGISFGDASTFIQEVKTEQTKYLQYEKLVLSNRLQWNESMSLRTLWSDRNC